MQASDLAASLKQDGMALPKPRVPGHPWHCDCDMCWQADMNAPEANTATSNPSSANVPYRSNRTLAAGMALQKQSSNPAANSAGPTAPMHFPNRVTQPLWVPNNVPSTQQQQQPMASPAAPQPQPPRHEPLSTQYPTQSITQSLTAAARKAHMQATSAATTSSPNLTSPASRQPTQQQQPQMALQPQSVPAQPATSAIMPGATWGQQAAAVSGGYDYLAAAAQQYHQQLNSQGIMGINPAAAGAMFVDQFKAIVGNNPGSEELVRQHIARLMAAQDQAAQAQLQAQAQVLAQAQAQAIQLAQARAQAEALVQAQAQAQAQQLADAQARQQQTAVQEQQQQQQQSSYWGANRDVDGGGSQQQQSSYDAMSSNMFQRPSQTSPSVAGSRANQSASGNSFENLPTSMNREANRRLDESAYQPKRESELQGPSSGYDRRYVMDSPQGPSSSVYDAQSGGGGGGGRIRGLEPPPPSAPSDGFFDSFGQGGGSKQDGYGHRGHEEESSNWNSGPQVSMRPIPESEPNPPQQSRHGRGAWDDDRNVPDRRQLFGTEVPRTQDPPERGGDGRGRGGGRGRGRGEGRGAAREGYSRDSFGTESYDTYAARTSEQDRRGGGGGGYPSEEGNRRREGGRGVAHDQFDRDGPGRNEFGRYSQHQRESFQDDAPYQPPPPQEDYSYAPRREVGTEGDVMPPRRSNRTVELEKPYPEEVEPTPWAHRRRDQRDDRHWQNDRHDEYYEDERRYDEPRQHHPSRPGRPKRENYQEGPPPSAKPPKPSTSSSSSSGSGPSSSAAPLKPASAKQRCPDCARPYCAKGPECTFSLASHVLQHCHTMDHPEHPCRPIAKH